MNIPVTDQMGALLAVFGALAVAFQSILVRKHTIKGSIRELIGIVILVNAVIWSGVSLLYYYPDFDVSAKSILAFIFSGIFGFFLGYILFFTSIKRIGASKTMPIIRTQVIVALILSIMFLGETLTPFHLLGICIMIVGTILVSREISGDDYPGSKKSRWTELLIPLAGGVSWGLNWFFTRLGLLTGTPVMVGLAISSLAALVGYTLLESIEKRQIPFMEHESPKPIWFIFIGMICALAFLFNFLALSISRVVVVNPIWQISPLFVLILSYLFLPDLEKITTKLVIGSLLIVGGTVIVFIFM